MLDFVLLLLWLLGHYQVLSALRFPNVHFTSFNTSLFTMRSNILLLTVMLARQATSSGYPELQWDPDTVKDCIEWWNNDDSDSCETVRKWFGLTPEIFNDWNPSVGIDCKPWQYQSYCVLTETKWNATKPTTTSSSPQVPSSTTKAATLAPSPTAWSDLGCYTEDQELPILDQNMNPSGDASLTTLKCKNTCYRRAFQFAGVQQGNQCWCGTYVGGNWASNQTSCNTPCSGDKAILCGGTGFLNIFKAEVNRVTSPATSGSIKPTIATTTGAIASKTGTAKRDEAVLLLA